MTDFFESYKEEFDDLHDELNSTPMTLKNKYSIIYQGWFLTTKNKQNRLTGKVHIFWEGNKILQNLHLTFVLFSASQK